jgi:putative ABC transport system permease protein
VDDPDVWVPGRLERLGPENVPPETGRWAIPLGRLRASEPVEVARARADVTLREAREGFRGDASGSDGGPPYALRWTPLAEELTRDARGALGLLQATVGLLLLLAGVNVATLLLARFGARSGEVATRHALGASRPRVVRQLVTESVGLALVGGAAGVALAALSLELVLQLAPPDIPRLEAVSLDAGVLVGALALSLAVGASFGLVPAVTATADAPGGAMREGARGTTGSRRRHRTTRGLATLQVALTVVLLVGAGLTARSFTLLTGRDPGFRTEGVLVLRLNVPESRHSDVRGLDGFYRRVIERLESVPGVRAVGLANRPPIDRSGSTREIRLAEGAEPRVAEYGVVGPGYFRALGIARLRGRPFDGHDDSESVPVAIVDRAFWEEAWPGEEPVGKRFLQGDAWRTVVGVVEGVRGGGLASDREPGFYIPHLQRPDDPVELAVGRSGVVLLHAPGFAADAASVSALHRAVHEEDPGQPVAEIIPLETLVADGARSERFRAILLGAFAAIGIVLSLSGIYGVIGQILVERRREFGVFRALGATSHRIVWRVLGWGMMVTLPGVALGLLAVLALGPWFEGLLFGVRPTDPGTLLTVSFLVVGMALTACAGPALGAVRIDPGLALRGE